MKQSTSNAALTILLTGATIITPSFAQEANANKPTPGGTAQYVGSDTRFGVGLDSSANFRGEAYQVLRSNDRAVTLAEIWGARSSGGVKLTHNWMHDENAVDKAFIAVDQGANSTRKATLGLGQEYKQWFWNGYVSRAISSARVTGVDTTTSLTTLTGADSGRAYTQDQTTTNVTEHYSKPYDWSLGGRVGHWYDAELIRVTAGLDYDMGKYSNRQLSASAMVEKYFQGSPISVALSGEVSRRSGEGIANKTDSRALLMLRYELGAPASSFRASKATRMITETVKEVDPNWKAEAAPAKTATVTTMRTEKKTTRMNSNDAQETYFDLGSAKLKPAAMKELDATIARIEAQRPYVEIIVNIVGHTCPTGSDRNNFPLSQKRADSVRAYLISKGVPANVISATGKAGQSPKYPEVKGQSFRNRRADTEILIVKETQTEVQVPVTTAAPAEPAKTAPMIERQVQREVSESAPNAWMARALRGSTPHRTNVDTYSWTRTTNTQTLGAKVYANRPPVAANDTYTVDCGTPTTFNVLANDSDPDGNALTITSVSGATKGTTVISGNKIVYTPSSSCTGGTDTFIYTISDGNGGTATATVTVNINTTTTPVTPVTNAPPVAVDDRLDAPCNSSLPLDVLRNDRDPNGLPLRIVSLTQPAGGVATVSISSDGKTINYVGGAACYNQTTFTYTISNGTGTSTATVTLIDP